MEATQTTNRADKFVEDFKINIGSGVGVLVVRTLEPFRLEDTLLNLGVELQKTTYSWDMVVGWKRYNMTSLDEVPTAFDNTSVQAVNALKMLKASNAPRTGSGQANNNTIRDDALLLMHWPQWALKSVPQAVQLLAQLSHELPETDKRLVLIVPPDYEIPTEVREMLTVMEFEVPDRNEMREILETAFSFVDEAKKPNYSDEEVHTILNASAGLTNIEAETAYSRAMVTHKDLLPSIPIDDFLAVVSAAKTEAVKRSDVLELMEAGSPDDIGGLEALKEWIELTAQCMTEEAIEFGVDRPKGMFLAGAAGTGKSASAKAVAGTLQLPLIKFDVSRVFSSLVGSSENRIKQALKLIESMAPCVALVDEVDKVFSTNSGGGDSGVGMRVLGTMLTFMQESNAGVFWVMTANRVSNLPPELLRKGRLDETFSVSVPNEEERLAVLQIHLRKRNQNPDDIEGLDEAVQASQGYVPAELEAAVKEAIKISFVTNEDVTGSLIAEQLGQMKPLSEAFAEGFREMEEWASNNARPASSAPITSEEARQAEPVKRRRTRTSGSRNLDA